MFLKWPQSCPAIGVHFTWFLPAPMAEAARIVGWNQR